MVINLCSKSLLLLAYDLPFSNEGMSHLLDVFHLTHRMQHKPERRQLAKRNITPLLRLLFVAMKSINLVQYAVAFTEQGSIGLWLSTFSSH